MNVKKRSMYNEIQKMEHIACQISLSDAQDVKKFEDGLMNLFYRTEKYETEMGKDLCYMNISEAKIFLSQFLCGGYSYQETVISSIKTYVDWAIDNGYSKNQKNVFFNIKTKDIDISTSYANTMVKDEKDLLESLESVLGVEMPDKTMLCILLLIFAGIPFKELFYVKLDDVDMNGRTIYYGSQNICMSELLYMILSYYLEATSIQKLGKHNVKHIMPIINEGYLISNTRSYGLDRDKMRLSYTSAMSKALKGCSKKLTPSGIFDSGVFYRMKLKEEKTGEIDFFEYLKTRKNQSALYSYPERVKKLGLHEYETWKRAFDA